MQSSTQGDERRTTPRYRVSVRAEYRHRGDLQTSKVFNLGTDGVFICADPPLPAGSALHVAIALPVAGQRVEAEGRVVWTNAVATADLPIGMGIRFTAIDPDSLQHLQEQFQTLL